MLVGHMDRFASCSAGIALLAVQQRPAARILLALSKLAAAHFYEHLAASVTTLTAREAAIAKKRTLQALTWGLP